MGSNYRPRSYNELEISSINKGILTPLLLSRNKHFQRNIDPVGIEEPETNIMRVEIQVIAPETFANSRQDQVGENSHVI